MDRKPWTIWPRDRAAGGFTLLEILVATVIGAFVTIAAATALKSVVSCREKIVQSTTASAELRFVCDMMRKDFFNIYRDSDFNNVKIVGISSLTDLGAADDVVFYSVNRVKARPAQPEGDLYEVEYGLMADPAQDKPYLVRRVWPNPVAEVEVPAGVMTVLSDKIVSFDVNYYYQEQWLEEWPVEMEEMPALISVSLALRPDETRLEILRHEFLVNFPRWPGGAGGGTSIGVDGASPAAAGGGATTQPGGTTTGQPGGTTTGQPGNPGNPGSSGDHP